MGHGMGDLPPDLAWNEQGRAVAPIGAQVIYHAWEALGTPGVPIDPADQAVIGALTHALANTTLRSEPAPHVHPPYRGRRFQSYTRTQILVPAATDADAFAGGNATRAAVDALGGTAISALLPAAVSTDFVQLAQFAAPQGWVVVIRQFGLRLHSALTKGVTARLDIGGQVVVDVDEHAAVGEPDAPFDIMAIVHREARATVLASNRTTTSSPLIDVLLAGWIFPVLSPDDTLDQLFTGRARGPRTGRMP